MNEREYLGLMSRLESQTRTLVKVLDHDLPSVSGVDDGRYELRRIRETIAEMDRKRKED